MEQLFITKYSIISCTLMFIVMSLVLEAEPSDRPAAKSQLGILNKLMKKKCVFNLRWWLGIRVSSVVKVRVKVRIRFKIRFDDFVAVPASDGCCMANPACQIYSNMIPLPLLAGDSWQEFSTVLTSI